jgi:hypothetical protein
MIATDLNQFSQGGACGCFAQWFRAGWLVARAELDEPEPPGIFDPEASRCLSLKTGTTRVATVLGDAETPSQLKLLREYAAPQGLTIVQECVDVETAKQTGRVNFGEMVACLGARAGTRIILVEKTDHLYRNLKDWVTLDALDVEIRQGGRGPLPPAQPPHMILCSYGSAGHSVYCRLHGGKSTGPTTGAGLERSRRARWKHGAYSRDTRALRTLARRNRERFQTYHARGKKLGSGKGDRHERAVCFECPVRSVRQRCPPFGSCSLRLPLSARVPRRMEQHYSPSLEIVL